MTVSKCHPIDSNVKSRVLVNDASMANTLKSTKELTLYDHCCGIHGAARERRGAKKATSSARRRHDKDVIQEYRDEMFSQKEDK